jgi:3-hydroxyisobutyrate dehydrogenase
MNGAIGFIGLGNMGWAMARNLAGAGFDLVVNDAAPGRADAFAADIGGQAVAAPAAVGRATGLVILMLPDGRVVREVLTRVSDGVIAGLAPGALVVDMSSSDPTVYDDLVPALAAKGARLIDAPVSGGVKGAEAATLTIMAGGEAALIDRAEPALQAMSARLFRTGGLGSGQAMKALNNLCSAGAMILTIEALLIGQRFGLDAKLMTEILNVSTGRNNSTDKKIIPHVLSRRFDSGFSIKLMTKDVQTALSIARATGTPSELGAHTLELARRALEELGDDADHTAIARFLEMVAGEELHTSEPV